MSNKMNENLLDLVDNYIYYVLNRGGLNPELEVKFGTRNIKKITKINFDNVIQKLKSLGFIPNNINGIYDLKIQNSYFDKNIQKTVLSNIRTEINGLYNIQQYCRTNKINLEHPIKFVQKTRARDQTNKPLEILNYDDFNFRVSLNVEDELPKTNNNVITLRNNWDKNKKVFRYINRVSFIHNDYPVRVDCSIVKSSTKENNKLIAENNIQDSNVFNNPISYEIEIEVLNDKIFGNHKEPEILVGAIKKVIKIVLSGLQNTDYPVGNNEMNLILNNYQSLLFDKTKIIPNYKLSSRNFIGPSNITLQLINLIDNPDSIEPNILRDYTVTEKADGIRKMCYINNDGKVYLLTTSLDVEFSGAICKNKEYFNTLIDGEHILYNKKGEFINVYAAFDVYFINGKDVRNLDFIRLIKDDEKSNFRLILLNNLIKTTLFVSIVNETISPIRIEIKKFYTTSKEASIFDGNRLILEKVKNNIFEYETDGLIFTPMIGGVGVNNKGEEPPNYRVTWDKCFKWKPPQYNTIDFLVSTVKVNQTDKISLLYENGENMMQNNQINKYKTLVLMVGFDIKKHGYLNPCENMLNGDFIVQSDKDNYNNYKPMPFYPTNPYIENANICNILLKPDENNNLQMFTKENEVFEDNMIVEFSYNIENKERWTWEPLRVRYDKTAEYRNNIKNYGCCFHTGNGQSQDRSFW